MIESPPLYSLHLNLEGKKLNHCIKKKKITSFESEDKGQLLADLHRYYLWPAIELDIILPAATFIAYFMAFIAVLMIFNMH